MGAGEGVHTYFVLQDFEHKYQADHQMKQTGFVQPCNNRATMESFCQVNAMKI